MSARISLALALRICNPDLRLDVLSQQVRRVYRVACGEGEEARLGGLARLVDAAIAGMRQRFGEIGGQCLIIMAAITLADE